MPKGSRPMTPPPSQPRVGLSGGENPNGGTPEAAHGCAMLKGKRPEGGPRLGYITKGGHPAGKIPNGGPPKVAHGCDAERYKT